MTIQETSASPVDARDVEHALLELQEDMRAIQTDLGMANRTDAEGRRLGFIEYQEWRTKAKVALKHKTDEYQHLKQALKELNVQTYRVRQDEHALNDLREIRAHLRFWADMYRRTVATPGVYDVAFLAMCRDLYEYAAFRGIIFDESVPRKKEDR